MSCDTTVDARTIYCFDWEVRGVGGPGIVSVRGRGSSDWRSEGR